MIVLCTIPHTGTQFFRGLLAQHYKPTGWDDTDPNGFITCHITNDALTHILDNRRNMTLVTTVRDWWAVQNSWQQRNRDFSEYPDYLGCWLDLILQNPFVLSVDHHKENRLKLLEQHLGVQFKTDWTPVNEWNPS